MISLARREDPFDLGDRQRHVFVPAVMGAGLLFSIATVVRDLIRSKQGRAPGFDRRLDIAGQASARHILTGESPATAIRAAVRPRVFYLLIAATTLGVALYVVIGASANYFRPGGYVAGIAWLWAVSLVLGAGLSLVGAQSLLLYLRWPRPPRAGLRLLVHTPLGRSPTAADQAELPRLLLGWAITIAAAATGILALMAIRPPWFVEQIDTSVTAAVAGWDWLSSLPLGMVGETGPAVALALLVGIATLRCRVFAVAYIAAMGGGWMTYLVLKTTIVKPRPPTGGWVGLDSFPSGHLVQATIIAGLVPVALTVLTRRRWPALLIAGPMMLAVLATALYRISLGVHWTTDVLAAVLIGATFVLAAHWALRHPRWHTRCHRPWPSPQEAT